MTEKLEKVVCEFLIIGIVQGFRRIVAGALARRVADGLPGESEDAFPEFGVLVVAADLLEASRHDAAERAAHGAA